MDKIKLQETQEVKETKKLELLIMAKKCAIADLYIDIENLKDKLDRTVIDLNELNEVFIKKIRLLAEANGIDVDNPKAGKWNLDTSCMTFTKIS